MRRPARFVGAGESPVCWFELVQNGLLDPQPGQKVAATEAGPVARVSCGVR